MTTLPRRAEPVIGQPTALPLAPVPLEERPLVHGVTMVALEEVTGRFLMEERTADCGSLPGGFCHFGGNVEDQDLPSGIPATIAFRQQILQAAHQQHTTFFIESPAADLFVAAGMTGIRREVREEIAAFWRDHRPTQLIDFTGPVPWLLVRPTKIELLSIYVLAMPVPRGRKYRAKEGKAAVFKSPAQLAELARHRPVSAYALQVQAAVRDAYQRFPPPLGTLLRAQLSLA